MCTENSVLVDCVNESPNVSGDDRSVMLPFDLVVSPLKSESQLEAENAALRHQLIVLQRKVRRRVHLTNRDRLSLVQLYRWFPSERVTHRRRSERFNLAVMFWKG